MNAQALVRWGVWGLAVGAAGLWFGQHHRLGALQEEAVRVRAEVAAQVRSSEASRPTVGAAPMSELSALDPEEKIELMRLRDRVSTLRERQRGSGILSNEHHRLKAQLASLGAGAARPMPEGYVRRREARQAGMATPEAVLESLLWALERRDWQALIRMSASHGTPEGQAASRWWGSEGGQRELESMAAGIPGFRVLERRELGPDRVELEVGLGPTVGATMDWRFRRVDGEWRWDR
ncbi:MAG: hypothetical protein KF833_10475 [Verrucomicrobiae bacterium]|nr:hypothetical protein [Verrucomicrobiae bacterium]